MRHSFVPARADLKSQPAGYSYRTVAYDHFQVIYLTEGRLHFYAEGIEQLLVAGDGVVLGVGSAFQLRCLETSYHGVGVNLYDDIVRDFHGSAVPFIGNQVLQDVAVMIQHEIAQPDIGTEHILIGLGSILYWQALRLTGSLASLPSEGAQDWAEKARQAILATLTTGNSVRAALGALPLSYRQLARYFSAQMGVSPKQYQQSCRLTEIKRLLCETNVSITTLAHEFGYPSSQHFSARFLRATGVTPGVYRRMHQIIP